MTKEIKEYIQSNASNYVITELIIMIYDKFGKKFETEYLRKYLNYHKIPYKKVGIRAFNQKQKDFLINISKDYTPRELMKMVNEKFNETYTLASFHSYLRKNNIPFKYEDKKKSHPKGKDPYPIGTESIAYGRVVVKVAPRKWIPKQRHIYQEHYGVKLTPNQFVIFIDGNIHNFDIDNLKVVDCGTAGYLGNYELRSKNKQVSELGISVARLMRITNNMRKGGVK